MQQKPLAVCPYCLLFAAILYLQLQGREGDKLSPDAAGDISTLVQLFVGTPG